MSLRRRSRAEEVTVVAAKELVPGIAGEAHRDVLARVLRDQKCGDLGRIRERLVVDCGQAGNDRLRFFGTHIQLGVVGAQVAGHRLGVFRLVVTSLGKADGEGAHAAGRLRLHQRHDGRRIHATREERPKRHIRYSLQRNRLTGYPLQLDQRRGVTLRERLFPGARRCRKYGPIHFGCR